MALAGAPADGPLNVLALTSQYPSAAQPTAASFNRQQLEALSRLCSLSLVAPVPWTARVRRWPAAFPPPPFPVSRPTFWYPPGLLRHRHGWCYNFSAWPALAKAAREHHPNVLLATWAYPDGWAGLLAARRLGLPLALKLHGSDVNDQPDDPSRRPLIVQALRGAAAVVAPSRALARRAVELGATAENVFVTPNGVDAGLFRPRDRQAARRQLGLPGDAPLVLFVGRLVEVKRPQAALEALKLLTGARLVVLGDGPLRGELTWQAAGLGLADRVIWAGDRPHEQVALFMAAADCLCLTSRNEGSPNVVREALASGLPVAATAVGGVPELLAGNPYALTAPLGDPQAMALAVSALLARRAPAQAVAQASAVFSWEQSASALLTVLRRAAASA